ncbi:N-acetyltransferase GCN5 [uncultured Woeseiaceae bacterium]|uniref:N-acetyltransferase GCN5 n=1 Tax=uncultured Woeseiaceae bacterium TaxID=1983305 RepID=A0A7D9D2I9_9GAMM|nr:N-acetyltransferase GCN5 [uncultured Woeseiaceae bacterium]
MNDYDIVSRPIVPSDWPAIERLFGVNGACGGCWCMLWRVPSLGRYWESAKGKRNKASFRKFVETGAALGCLAWIDDEPVGWCGVGPRQHYPYLQRSRTIPAPGIDNVWCVSCFFIPRCWRGKGIAGHLLTTALAYSRSAGAASLEGYPTVPKSATKLIPPAFAHTGVPQLFESAGFKWVHDIGARQVWRSSFDRADRRRR